jgi:hypothetical protein
MALIIEDGTNVANADSFATVAECRTYADNRGLTLPAADADVEVLLRKGTDYLNSIESKFQGYRYYYADGQALCFPRGDIYEFDRYIGMEIPQRLKDAQCQLAFDANSNTLLSAGDGREVIEKKVGPLTTKWNPNGSTSPQYDPVAALALLEPLFKAGSGSSINLLSYR